MSLCGLAETHSVSNTPAQPRSGILANEREFVNNRNIVTVLIAKKGRQ